VFKSGVTLSTGMTFTDSGTISANGNSITPTALGYVANLSSDAQSQLTSLQSKCTNISYSSGLTSISAGSYGSLYVNSNAYPTSSSGNSGTCFYWNSITPGLGQTDILNYSQGGTGGFTFNICSSTVSPKTILNIDSNGNISGGGNIVLGSSKYIDLTACISSSGLKVSSSSYLTSKILNYLVNISSDVQTQINNLSSSGSTALSYNSSTSTTTVTGNLQVNGLYETSTTALTYTSTSVGYTTSYLDTDDRTIINANTFGGTGALTLGIGVWMISGVAQFYYTSTANVLRYLQFAYVSGEQVIDGTQNSVYGSMVANTSYSMTTGCTCITITTAGTQISMFYSVSIVDVHTTYLYLSATKIG
jgi:hypothetical protein